jgi:hypothetical protein
MTLVLIGYYCTRALPQFQCQNAVCQIKGLLTGNRRNKMKCSSLAVFAPILLVSAIALSLLGCGVGSSSGGNCSTGFPYCMTLVSGGASDTTNVVGYSYTGSMVFKITTPAGASVPANTLIGLTFTNANGQTDLNGGGTSSGNPNVTFTIGGTSEGWCAFAYPEQVNAYFNGNTSVTEALGNITWKRTTC